MILHLFKKNLKDAYSHLIEQPILFIAALLSALLIFFSYNIFAVSCC